MAGIINEKLIHLCIEVLSSQAPADVKDECIDCHLYPAANEIVLSKELVGVIKRIDIYKTCSIMGNSKNALACRVLILRIIVEQRTRTKCWSGVLILEIEPLF